MKTIKNWTKVILKRITSKKTKTISKPFKNNF